MARENEEHILHALIMQLLMIRQSRIVRFMDAHPRVDVIVIRFISSKLLGSSFFHVNQI